MKPLTDQQKTRMREYYESQLAKLNNPKSAFNSPRKPVSSEVQAKRMYVWRHNSLIGQTFMVRSILNAVMASPSATTEAKHHASTMLGLVTKLQNSLSVRVDPK